VDARANAIFLHEDEAGLCGFEKRNRNFKGFADLGEKGLWTSNAFPEDRHLVIGESSIDCISYEVLFPGGRYASIAGGLNPKQPELILQAAVEVSLTGYLECHGRAASRSRRNYCASPP
jgi:hypothetical protein